MCRWAAYSGAPIFLEELIASPAHSLIEQSQSAHKAKTPINGDGFGIAWYGDHPEPGLYRDVLPAWSDANLRSLARHIRSGLFLAHVRASTEGAVSRDNCHPFTRGRWSFMHNGQIGDFGLLRRDLEAALSDEAYGRRAGTTDSELLFLLAVDHGLDDDPAAAFVHALALVIQSAAKRGVDPLIRFTAALSDGERLIGIRYATDRFAPSLYWTQMGDGGDICLVSEPFDDTDHAWMAVPAGSIVTIENGDVRMQPFGPALAVRAA